MDSILQPMPGRGDLVRRRVSSRPKVAATLRRAAGKSMKVAERAKRFVDLLEELKFVTES